MARRTGAATVTADVYRQLRVGILTGRYLPGQRLSPAALSQQFGASQGVVREALTRLSSERLVSGAENKGFRVFEISFEDLQNLCQVRELLETEALRLSIANADARWESEILAAHHRLASAPSLGAELDQSGLDAFMIAHREFHMSLLSGCGNRLLFDTCGSFWDAGELYRRWSVARSHEWETEHAALVAACLDHDAERAADILTRHIGGTVRALQEMHARGAATPQEVVRSWGG